uniref:Uncharacterized protein n=1 Tax=Syphacia muris TaxID=451379 RepID=A0A0N5AYN8_9BILA
MYIDRRYIEDKSSLIIILLFYIAGNYPVSALRRYEYSNVDADGQYRCYQEVLNNAPLMKLSRQTIFDQPCKCRVDWKLAFCNDLNYFMQQKHNEDINLPEVCICRCSCCFNQAEEHCNQLPCSNGEPLFEATSNTTCICYSPSAYPYHLCLNVKLSPTWLNVASEELDNQNSVRRQQKLLTEGDKMVNNDSVLISGIRITPKNACIILFSLIGVCILMTSVWITIRYLRLKREHTERSNRLQQAQAELLRRRDSEERYLP